MSDIDQTFTSKGIFREETLYYDLGYRFSKERGRKPIKALEINFTGYIFVTSLLLQVTTSASQFITLSLLGAFYVYSSLLTVDGAGSMSPRFIIFLFIGNAVDHLISGLVVRPGVLINEDLTVFTWILEIIWVTLYTIQVIVILQPVTPVITKGLSVKPDTQQTINDLKLLKTRLKGTDFELRSLKNVIDIRLIKESLFELSKIVSVIVGLSLLLDVLIWRVVGTFGDQTNVVEEYFISGLVLILFSLLLIYTGYFFPSDDNLEEEEEEIDEQELLN